MNWNVINPFRYLLRFLSINDVANYFLKDASGIYRYASETEYESSMLVDIYGIFNLNKLFIQWCAEISVRNSLIHPDYKNLYVNKIVQQALNIATDNMIKIMKYIEKQI